ncbi:MAG: VOC family protein [Gemmatimonadetes bacterium]|nr:VOC family protein [Gemmatimonadota bacterium]
MAAGMSGAPGHRLPAGTRPGGVTLQVADLARSLAWYDTVLGLRATERADASAVLSAVGDRASLVVLHERPGAAAVPRSGRLGLYHYALLLPDRAALGRFLAHASGLGVPIGSADHLVSEALYLQDPDGLGIEVYADRPRASWRMVGGQLQMATDPLDVAGVLRAGGGEPWTGMPAGTTVGHLHLQVGDLARAAAFYQHALGLELTVGSYPGALFLAAGGYHHHLGLNTWARSAPPAGPEDARLLEWELVLPERTDLERALASIAAAGYPVARTEAAARVRDEWGTVLLLRSERTD